MNNEERLAEKSDKAQLGFWLYLMTDCMLFTSLFATYMVLRHSTNGGPGGSEIFSIGFVLIETLILLTSSYLCGLANLAIHNNHLKEFAVYLGATIALGVAFLVMELTEFGHLITEGHGWQSSAFLSSFFTLVGVHGLHITIGLLWALVLVWALYRQGSHEDILRKFSMFAIFWHFLDIVWIFIFTIVYVMGVR